MPRNLMSMLNANNYIHPSEAERVRRRVYADLAGLEWTEAMKTDFRSRLKAIIRQVGLNSSNGLPHYHNSLRMNAVVSNKYILAFPEVVEELLMLNENTQTTGAILLMQSRAVVGHPLFMHWMTKLYESDRARNWSIPTFERAERTRGVAKAFRMVIDRLSHSSQAREVIMSMYDSQEALAFFRPELRVFYRSQAFVDYITWNNEQSYSSVLIYMFSEEEPLLSRAYREAMAVRTPHPEGASVHEVQATFREYQSRRKPDVERALAESQAAFEEWLTTDPFYRPADLDIEACDSALNAPSVISLPGQ